MTQLLDSSIVGCDEDYKYACRNDDLKEFIENCWKWYEPFADKNFSKEIRTQSKFHERFWEMYLACTLKEFGKELRKKSKKEGPDICIEQGTSTSIVWVEAYAAKSGEGANKVPPLAADDTVKLFHVPEEKILLRYTSGWDEKYKKYCGFIKKGVVASTAPYVIAINGAKVPYAWDVDDDIPYIIQAVSSFGPQTIETNWENPSESTVGFAHRSKIITAASSPVLTNIFEREEYKGISGIIFSREDIYSFNKQLGKDLILVHNRLAQNKLPEGWLRVGREYRFNGNSLECRRWSK
jgi:hypothetical protein